MEWNVMRRIISLLLALVLCLALPMTAFAATASVGNSAPVTSNPKTGDIANMQFWIPVLIVSALALAAIVVIYFKKFRKAN